MTHFYFRREEQKYFDNIELLETTCQDFPLPVDIEAIKDLLSKLHALKRSMLESLMVTLQEGKIFLEKLKCIAAAGSLDSRPDHIRVAAERGK